MKIFDTPTQTEILVGVAGYAVLTLIAAVQVRRVRRLHYVGRITHAVYRAKVVTAVFPIVFVPVVIGAAYWLGYLVALLLCFGGIGIMVWADETEKNR